MGNNMNFEKAITPFTLRDGTALEPLIVKLLKKRGLKTNEEVQRFLEPELKDLPSPFLMAEMDRAAQLVSDCILNKGSILIWGDYDVDGTTSTALLLLFFEMLNCNVDYYIPNRLTEGYGLQSEALERYTLAQENKADLLITVDNGISAHDAVIAAKKMGYSVLVTDHHTPPETRVPADAVLNPRQENCSFPGKDLAGVGVAFYLAIAVRSALQKKNFFNNNRQVPNLKQFLDLVAIGTVADMVELDSVNRILVRAGMETLSEQSNIGITTLCEQSNVDHKNIRSEDISFQLAPKINAAGRLGCANKAVALLQCKSTQDASALSTDLFQNNEERKSITLENFHNAKDEVMSGALGFANSTVVAGQYHIGVAGIVASNLVEEYEKPTIVLCEQESGILKGSARSVQGVNLYDALSECSDFLLGFGGHAMAAGMSLKIEHLQNFKELFDAAVYSQNGGEFVKTEKHFDSDSSVREIFEETTLAQLQMLEPHGIGNPQPIFRDQSVSFTEASPIGKDKSHLRLAITDGTSIIRGIAFGLGGMAGMCLGPQDKTIIYSPSPNYFRGRRSWQVRVLEISNNAE